MIPLGTVLSFSEVLAKTTATTAIPSRTAEDAIAVDSGGKTTISLQFAHPHGQTDELNGNLQLKNGDWVQYISRAVNRWQSRTDGVTLTIRVEDGNDQFHVEDQYRGYITSLSFGQQKGMPESITGTLQMTLGSRTITGGSQYLTNSVTVPTPCAYLSETSISVSLDKGVTWGTLVGAPQDLSEGNVPYPEEEYEPPSAVVKSYTISGGYLEPFEKLQIIVSSELFHKDPYVASKGYGEGLMNTGPQQYQTRFRIEGIGRGEYVVTNVDETDNYITFTAYSTAIAALSIQLGEELDMSGWRIDAAVAWVA